MKKLILLLSAAVVMTGCASHERIEQPPQGVQARLIQPHSSSGDAGLRFSAVVTPDSQVPLGFRIPGYVVALKQVRGENGRMRDIGEGDAVSQGTVLVRIRPAEYEDKVHQASSQAEAAEAAAQRATLDFERAKRLYDSQSMTKPDFDAARAQYDGTQAQLRAARAGTSEAQIALRDTSLVAPFNGDIVKKNVELGAFVGPGSPLFSIAKTDTVKIVIGVPDTTVRSLKLGQPVEVSVDAFPNRAFHARISRMASAADPTTRNFEVEVAIPNRDHMLKVGMIGSLQFANAGDVK
jgi:RND family efflux transporter MFP subunit